MRWILLDLLRHIFPRKISPEYRTYTLRHPTASHLWQGVPSWEEWGGHRPLFCPCAGMRIRRHRHQNVVANAYRKYWY